MMNELINHKEAIERINERQRKLIKALETEHEKLREIQKALKNVPNTNVEDMPCSMDKVLEDLYKLQKECPELEIILETKNGTVSCKIDDANIYIGINKELVFDAE